MRRLALALLVILWLASPAWGALQFNGTSQCGYTASNLALSSATVITVVEWLWWDSYGNDDKMSLEYSANYNTSNAFLIDPNGSGTGEFDVAMSQSNSTHNSGYVSRVTVTGAAWNMLVYVLDRTTGTALGVIVYLNGSSISVTQAGSANISDNFDNAVLNVMSRSCASSPAFFGAGRKAELAVFTRGLSSGDVTELWNSGAGKAACLLSTGAANYYWPLNTDGAASSGGINITLVGSPSNVTHPVSVAGCDATGTPARRRF